jgi:tRNA/tmRNA/rRNA uracil-C5-methylase (TrmA/RlmC/RlmD family)
MYREYQELRFRTLRVENGRETRELWPKLRKNGPTLSQILVSIVDKTAHLGGNVCAKILSDPLQLGPRAKTLRQEIHFSYHMQLSDRQEFLQTSRDLSQKMTPWHKEHSDGLRSQDHILRTQTRLCARPVPLKSR